MGWLRWHLGKPSIQAHSQALTYRAYPGSQFSFGGRIWLLEVESDKSWCTFICSGYILCAGSYVFKWRFRVLFFSYIYIVFFLVLKCWLSSIASTEVVAKIVTCSTNQCVHVMCTLTGIVHSSIQARTCACELKGITQEHWQRHCHILLFFSKMLFAVGDEEEL